jgi:hypothetical protein
MGVATLRASLAGDDFELAVAPDHDRGAVTERLRVPVAALLQQLRGGMSIHAASVARRGHGLAVLGDSGSGKSTLAAQLCDHPGVELLSDDTVSFLFEPGRALLLPVDETHALRPDVARTMGLQPDGERKVLRPAQRAARTPVPIRALVTPVFDDAAKAPLLRPVHGLGAFSVVNRAVIRFVVDDPVTQRRELDNIARIVEQAPLFELVRSRDLANLPATADLAMKLLCSLGEGG